MFCLMHEEQLKNVAAISDNISDGIWVSHTADMDWLVRQREYIVGKLFGRFAEL